MPIVDMQARTQALLRDLVAQTSEQPWLEFKANNADPVMIGKTLSAIANGAALTGKAVGYVVWGVEDALHSFVGTSFDPDNNSIGNQPFKIWLSQKLEPFHDVRFVETTVEGKRIILAEVPAAARSPVRFDNYAYVRVGASTTRVVDHPEIERQL